MTMAFALAVMGIVAYAQLREGILTAAMTLVNVVLAGLAAFLLFEPMADEVGKMLTGTAVEGMEDAICLFGVFAAVMGVLRVATNNMANQDLDVPALPQQIGTVLIGLVAGYFLAGFLLVMVSTLPLPEKFLGYDAEVEAAEPATRRYFPPDRAWLGLMQHAGTPAGLGAGGVTFDPEGTFPLRYAKKRRIKEAP
ncbi:MAG: CvpA family protein [Gemmataceae bacterium]